MDWQSTMEIVAGIEKTGLRDLKKELFTRALYYARLRAEWCLLDREERRDADPARSAAHEALIDACNILSRNMGRMGENNTWRARLGEDRRGIGDFACYLHALLGIRAR